MAASLTIAAKSAPTSPRVSFAKDDILYIDNTMYNGVPGNWSAWFVNQEGKTTQWGIIPSKYKVIRRSRTHFLNLDCPEP